MGFIRVLVSYECAAVGKNRRSSVFNRILASLVSKIKVSAINPPIFGVRTFDVLALLEVGLQVHGEQRRTGRVVGAPHRPVVTVGFMFSAQKRKLQMDVSIKISSYMERS